MNNWAGLLCEAVVMGIVVGIIIMMIMVKVAVLMLKEYNGEERTNTVGVGVG
jgi:hypothetical protein